MTGTLATIAGEVAAVRDSRRRPSSWSATSSRCARSCAGSIACRSSASACLITRPAQQAHEFARALYARGVEPILASTIAIVPPDDVACRAPRDRRARAAIAGSCSPRRTASTRSSIASPRSTADARYIGATKVAAIGSKTAERLRAFGVRADLVPAAFVSEEIARALIEATHTGDRVLIYRAQEARDVLPQMLEDAGREPHVVAAYKTIFDVDPEFAQKVATRRRA